MKKYLSRMLSSERNEKFNPLIWPFLLATLAYGIGFTVFNGTEAISKSSLYQAMENVYPGSSFVWGSLCVLTIVVGLTFLLFNIPPAGKVSGLVGFMLWIFATICWAFNDGIILVFSIGIPNTWFWFWQYLSLSLFRREDAEDAATMVTYDTGGYDDIDPDVDSEQARLDNRGVAEQ